VEWLLHQTLASVHHNILHLIQVDLGKKNEKNPSRIPNGFLCAYLLFHVLFPQLLSQGSTDVTVLQAEVSRAQEAITAVEASHVAAMLATETSAWEAAMAWDSTNLRIKGAKDWAALAERDAQERVSLAEVENSIALSSARADTEDLLRKLILLEDKLAEECRVRETSEREHREYFEELTLLQTQGSKLCHAIIGPPRARHLSEEMCLVALRHIEMAGELAAF
jgi:hypothetical protein